jgi:hypothetical protein
MKLLFTFPLLYIFIFFSSVHSQTTVANFGLKDQNDKYVEVKFPSDRPVVLIFGDRKGAGQIDGWSQPIYKKYEGKVYVFGIASLGGVPSYARGLVRRLIKRQTSYSVLMDWGGKIASSLGYQKDKAMMVVVGRNGTILSTKYGAATDTELDQVYAELDKQLK